MEIVNVLFAVGESEDGQFPAGRESLNSYGVLQLCVCSDPSEVVVIWSYSLKCYRRRGEYSTATPAEVGHCS